MYAPSTKFLGVWVTRPLSRKGTVYDPEKGKYVKSTVYDRHEKSLMGITPIEVGCHEWQFNDWKLKVLGAPEANICTLTIAPIWIGWTRDAGCTFITDDDMIAEKDLIPSMDAIKEGWSNDSYGVGVA